MRVYLLRHGGRLFFAHDHATALIFSTSKGLLLEPPTLSILPLLCFLGSEIIYRLTFFQLA